MISVTAEEMKRVDDLAIGKYKIRLEQMMELAGYHLARCARESLNGSLAGTRVVILAGKGNNGGGGLVAARHLSNWGCRVAVVVSHSEGLGDVVKERLEKAQQMNAKHEKAGEEENDEKEELLSMINEALCTVYPGGFEDLGPAVRALVDDYIEVVEEAEDQV